MLWRIVPTLLVVLAGCAAPVKVDTDILLPPRVLEAARLKRVAVLRFDRLGGTDITADVEAQLANARVEGAPFFTLVERARLSEAMKEMRLAESGALNTTTASKLGQMIAANGLYMGGITRDDVSEQQFSESRSICAQYEEKRDKKGNPYQGPCLRWSERQVSCVRRSANFEFVPKLLDVSMGTIVYTRNIAGTAQAKACADDNAPLAAKDDLRRAARIVALKSFREDIAPFTRAVQIAFLSANDGIANAAAKERFENSIAFARARRLDRACEMWEELAASEVAAPALTYNRGSCAEVSGNLERALALYNEADRQMSQPDKTVGEGLARVKERLAAERTLRSGSAQALPAARPGTGATPAATMSPSQVPAHTVAPVATRSGASKDEVQRAQTRLNALGFSVGTPDGLIGARTRTAVQRFQSTKRLPATGELDEETLKALGVQ